MPFIWFFWSFMIFEFLPLIKPAALRIPLQLTLLLWWYGPTQLTHWLLPCVAQQLASDYIWAMHQIIAQTVAWAIDFSSKSLPSWQRGCNKTQQKSKLQGNSKCGRLIHGRNSKIIKDRQKEANKLYGLFSGIIINNSFYDWFCMCNFEPV